MNLSAPSQPVSLIASPYLSPPRYSLTGLAATPFAENAIRQAFDQLYSNYRLTLNLAAVVDDMAMMRLIARDTQHIAIMAPVVVAQRHAKRLRPTAWRMGEVLRHYYSREA